MRMAGGLRLIEHIAALELGPHVTIPEMVRALDGLLPQARAGFFWVDERGQILEAYAPAGIAGARPPVIAPGPLLRCDRAGGVELNLRVGARLRAVLAVRAAAAPLNERDRRVVRAVEPAFARALVGPTVAAAAAVDEVAEETGVLIAAGDARLVSADPVALRLLDEMEGRPVGGTAAGRDQAVPLALAELVRGAGPRHPRPAILQRRSRWGAYRARAFPQPGEAGLAAVVITKHLPSSVRLLRTLATLDLSPREREVAFQLGRGTDTEEGARALGVSVATWRSYVKRVYQRLDVHDRLGLFARLNGTPLPG